MARGPFSVTGSGEETFWGGTSFVAPQLNGVTALYGQYLHGRLGLLNPLLYSAQNQRRAAPPPGERLLFMLWAGPCVGARSRCGARSSNIFAAKVRPSWRSAAMPDEVFRSSPAGRATYRGGSRRRCDPPA
jgi:hypothetical protein